MDCFGTDFTHVQTCDVTRVQSATQYDCFGAYFTHCFGVRLSVFGFRFSAFGFWPSACGFRFSSFGFRLPASCFVCTTSAFGFRLSAFVAWIPNPVRLSGSCLHAGEDIRQIRYILIFSKKKPKLDVSVYFFLVRLNIFISNPVFFGRQIEYKVIPDASTNMLQT